MITRLKNITPPLEPVEPSVEDIQENMRRMILSNSLDLLPKLFDSLQEMQGEQFVKNMMQVLKFSLPTYKAVELTEKTAKCYTDSFFQKYGINLKEWTCHKEKKKKKCQIVWCK